MDYDLRDDLRDGVTWAIFGLVPPKFPNFGLGIHATEEPRDSSADMYCPQSSLPICRGSAVGLPCA